ncbi:type II toxin-antitoxin system VapC family toxin [Ramlibacter ginsenosidimutans]|uniref:Type II toxin-antitoxin system VapC family toxin n=1 Tax=Ramlibacter ginsenosidimutans TaxID=502333 RepID=A0A934TQS1_9BURK|nr:type II toxin-antitoxin system VapC family toxin [Ramlibacter ginsenosidimutans]
MDCSVLGAALFEEDTRDDAWRILAGKTLHAPLLLDSEMVSVAAKKSRAGLAADVVANVLADYARQEIEFHRPPVEEQYALAMRYGVSPYDAAYLWVAGDLHAPLATFDAKLAKAARAYLAGGS